MNSFKEFGLNREADRKQLLGFTVRGSDQVCILMVRTS